MEDEVGPGAAPAAEITVTEFDILFDCPACAKSMVVDESAVDQAVECPQCGQTVIVPPRSAHLGDLLRGRESELEAVAPHDIYFDCPACDQSMVVDATGAGQVVECTGCGVNVIVPKLPRRT